MSGPEGSVFVFLASATLTTATAGWTQDVDASPSSPPISIAPSASASSSDPWTRILAPQGGPTVFLAACCKTCRKGKACRDSCISQSKTCQKGTGCACDG